MKRILYLLLALPLLSGCYEDKSSKRYDPIGSIIISDLEEQYFTVIMVDPLTVKPNITSTDPDDNPDEFEYRWMAYLAAGDLFTYQTYILAEGKGVKEIVGQDITLTPGKYTLQLRVINPRNGYTVYATTALQVDTEFTTGYYFLKETAGGDTELDFLSAGGDYALNLLEKMTGEPIAGPPTRLGYFRHYSYMDDESGQMFYAPAIIPMGGKDMKLMMIENMSLIYDHATMFYGEPMDEKPLMCFMSFSSPCYVSDKGIYKSAQSPGDGPDYYGTGKFGLPSEPPGGSSLSHINVVAASVTSVSRYVFFDELNGRLVYYNTTGSVQNLTTTNPDPDYDPNNINRTLLFMGTNGWAVFQDKTGGMDRYLYEIYMSSNYDPIESVKLIDPQLNFAKAQVYGSNKFRALHLLYAGVGDKFYVYDTTPGINSETSINLKGVGAGEEITMITHKPYSPGDCLIIATYKGGNYKVYMYELSSGLPLDEPITVAEGQGRVVDVQYVTPNISSSYNVNY